MKKNAHEHGSWPPAVGLALIGLAVLLLAGAGIAIWQLRCAPRVVPGEEWASKSPLAAGFSSEKLAAFSERVGGAGCILHRGEMIHSWGDISARQDMGGAADPLYAFWAMRAIQDGLAGSLDDRILVWAPALRDLNPDLDFKDRQITLRHLLNQTSGYGLQEKPGEAFATTGDSRMLLAHVLNRGVYRARPGRENQLFSRCEPHLTLGFEDDPILKSETQPLGRIFISVRDLARFGLLTLYKGRWGDATVLRQDLFQEMLDSCLSPKRVQPASGKSAERLPDFPEVASDERETNHLGCRGLAWWFNRRVAGGDGWLLPELPRNILLAEGWGGRTALILIPRQRLVVVWALEPQDDPAWRPFSESGRLKVADMLHDVLDARAEPNLHLAYEE